VRTLLSYVVALVLVGGLLFLAASFAFGRDEEMAPALPEGTPAELPDDRPATGADLRALRLAVVLRGYRMEEVDWVLDRLAEQVDARDREIARLRSVLHVEPLRSPPDPAEDPAASGSGLGSADERLITPEAPLPVRADTPGRVRPAVRDRLTGPGPNPVRGLRADAGPEPDQR